MQASIKMSASETETLRSIDLENMYKNIKEITGCIKSTKGTTIMEKKNMQHRSNK